MTPFFKLCAAIVAISLVTFGNSLKAADNPSDSPQWWKGNLHTHSFWSDGDDFPEMIVGWYKEHGYHFLALSDHNILAEGQKWVDVSSKRSRTEALTKYLKRFGAKWVEQRLENGTNLVRLKPLGEYRHWFEAPQRFLTIQSEEISDHFQKAPIHLNATNLRNFIPAQGGSNVVDVMQRNVDAVLKQRKETGQPMFPHLNHPNFGWAITAEELMQVQGERFFEVYNGHPQVHNEGDTNHASTDRVWDIILTWRLALLGLEPMFALGVDDSHNYHDFAPDQSNSGRGWIMVRAPFLTPEHLISAIEAGDFYASSGVQLRDVRRTSHGLALEIEPEDGVQYRTEFLGTRANFNRESQPVKNGKGEVLRVTQRYSPDIGVRFAESTGTKAEYQFRGDELYVRARVTSSKLKTNAVVKGEFEVAWTQPAIGPVKPVSP
jgi:hypothetical protein